MKANPIKIKNYANYMGSKSVLKTKPVNISRINPSEIKLDKQQFGYIKNMKDTFGKVIGTVKIQERNTNKFVNANIRKIGGWFNRITLEKDGNSLFRCDFASKFYLGSDKKELELFNMNKENAGENFKELAKTIDRLAVKESRTLERNGKVRLTTDGKDCECHYGVAEPIHWSRGYIDESYVNNPSDYDGWIKEYFDNYQIARRNGKSIAEAKLDMGIEFLPETKMVLKEEKVNEYLKETTLLELF